MTETTLLSRTEVARALRISTVHLDVMRATGKGPPPVKIGRRVLFVRQDVEAFMEGLRK